MYVCTRHNPHPVDYALSSKGIQYKYIISPSADRNIITSKSIFGSLPH